MSVWGFWRLFSHSSSSTQLSTMICGRWTLKSRHNSMILPSKFHSVLLHVTQTNTEQRESVKSVSFCVAMRENAAKRSEKKAHLKLEKKKSFPSRVHKPWLRLYGSKRRKKTITFWKWEKTYSAFPNCVNSSANKKFSLSLPVRAAVFFFSYNFLLFYFQPTREYLSARGCQKTSLIFRWKTNQSFKNWTHTQAVGSVHLSSLWRIVVWSLSLSLVCFCTPSPYSTRFSVEPNEKSWTHYANFSINSKCLFV